MPKVAVAQGLCNVIPCNFGILMIWGIFPPLSGWTEATISIFQSSAQTGKPQKKNTDQTGLPIFLTAMLCSWIGQ